MSLLAIKAAACNLSIFCTAGDGRDGTVVVARREEMAMLGGAVVHPLVRSRVAGKGGQGVCCVGHPAVEGIDCVLAIDERLVLLEDDAEDVLG